MIWIAIYWLSCFAILLQFIKKKKEKQHPLVILAVFLMSPILPLLTIFFIIKSAMSR